MPSRITYDFAGPDHPIHEGHDDPNAIVFLTAPRGFKMRKKVRDVGDHMVEVIPPGRTSSTVYPKGATYTFEAHAFDGLEDFADLIATAVSWENSFCVRGGVLSSKVDKCARVHTKGKDQSLVEVPRSWAMIDIDETEVVLPPDWFENEEVWVRAVIRDMLPRAFHDAGVVVAYSSKAHFKGGKPRMHLFFLFDRPLSSADVKEWAGGLADTSVLTPSQPHLIARPEYLDEAGNTLPDPFEDFAVLLLDGPAVQSPSEERLRRARALRAASEGSGSFGEPVGEYGWTRFLEHFADDEAPEHGLNRVVLKLTMSYCSLTPPKNRDREMLRALTRQAVNAAVATGRLRRTAPEIAQELGSKFDDMFERAAAKSASRWGYVAIRPAERGDYDCLGVVAPLPPGAFDANIFDDPTPDEIEKWEAALSRGSFFGG